jgi:hypothetical protein
MRERAMKQRASFDAEGRVITGRPKLVRPCLVTPEDEAEFMRAMENYKFESGRQFPTWSEILEVLRNLGYAKRIWRPIEMDAASAPESVVPGQCFEAMGQDSVTGVLCWYSRVETPVGF